MAEYVTVSSTCRKRDDHACGTLSEFAGEPKDSARSNIDQYIECLPMTDLFSERFSPQVLRSKNKQARNRRGPKLVSQPSTTTKIQRNRQAQRAHRERKQQYINRLECTISRLERCHADIVEERDALVDENRRLSEIITDSTKIDASLHNSSHRRLCRQPLCNANLHNSNGHVEQVQGVQPICNPCCSHAMLTNFIPAFETPCTPNRGPVVDCSSAPADKDIQSSLENDARPSDTNKHLKRKRSCSQLFNFQEAFMRLPDVALLDAGSRDPLTTFPVAYKPWYGWLLDFWYRAVLPKARHLLKCDRKQINDYISWSRQFEVTEPALFYTSLFLASGIPVAEGKLQLEKALWLRGRAVRVLNEALGDTKRASSTALICAVGKIALHEHVYGDRQAAHHVHRPAQQRMIAIRGGVENLGLPPITIQLMVWYDALMAAEAGTIAYFAELPKKLGLPNYNDKEAMRVTQTASPHRHRHPGYGSTTLP